MTAQISPRSRADVNRANSQHSTGPTSSIGKARSAQNSFKHGLYSKQLILPGEDPADFDELRAGLRSEHQPANTTEEILLVDELAPSAQAATRAVNKKQRFGGLRRGSRVRCAQLREAFGACAAPAKWKPAPFNPKTWTTETLTA